MQQSACVFTAGCVVASNAQAIVKHGSRLTLAIYFFYHDVLEMDAMLRDPANAPEGGFAIVKATCLTALA